jgi:SagB-type dehydrogenase family enzyme
MRIGRAILLVALVAVVLVAGAVAWMRFGPVRRAAPLQAASGASVPLPEPDRTGGLALHAALDARRSVRDYGDEPLTLAQIGQLLWAAQGITDPRGFRTAPSAGALFPLELYLVAGNVESLVAGVYHFDPQGHTLTPMAEGDVRDALAAASIGQAPVARGAAVIVLAAEYERMTPRYGRRGEMYAHIEIGHAGQNVYLQAASLGLGTVAIGAFEPDPIAELLGLPEAFVPLYLMPVGHPVD